MLHFPINSLKKTKGQRSNRTQESHFYQTKLEPFLGHLCISDSVIRKLDADQVCGNRSLPVFLCKLLICLKAAKSINKQRDIILKSSFVLLEFTTGILRVAFRIYGLKCQCWSTVGRMIPPQDERRWPAPGCSIPVLKKFSLGPRPLLPPLSLVLALSKWTASPCQLEPEYL